MSGEMGWKPRGFSCVMSFPWWEKRTEIDKIRALSSARTIVARHQKSGEGRRNQDIFRRFSHRKARVDGEEGKRCVGFGRPSSSSWRERETRRPRCIVSSKNIWPAERERGGRRRRKEQPGRMVAYFICIFEEGGVLYVDVGARGGKISGKDISALLIADCRGFLPDKWGPEPVFPSSFFELPGPVSRTPNWKDLWLGDAIP